MFSIHIKYKISVPLLHKLEYLKGDEKNYLEEEQLVVKSTKDAQLTKAIRQFIFLSFNFYSEISRYFRDTISCYSQLNIYTI